jgi:hypothetical protein
VVAKPKKKRRKETAAERKAESKREKGKKHPHKGTKETAAERKAASKRDKGKKHPHKGHKESAATRKKISKKLKGRHYHRKHKPKHPTKAKARTRASRLKKPLKPKRASGVSVRRGPTKHAKGTTRGPQHHDRAARTRHGNPTHLSRKIHPPKHYH